MAGRGGGRTAQLGPPLVPVGEAERLFAALDSSHTGVLDTEDLLRLGDSALAPTGGDRPLDPRPCAAGPA